MALVASGNTFQVHAAKYRKDPSPCLVTVLFTLGKASKFVIFTLSEISYCGRCFILGTFMDCIHLSTVSLFFLPKNTDRRYSEVER